MRHSILLIAIFISNFLFSQELYDQNWILGFGKYVIQPPFIFGGTWLDFGDNPPDTSSFSTERTYVLENSNISNSKGDLQFYTNGCGVYNSAHVLMKNGDKINFPGDNYNSNCATYGYYRAYRSVISMPQPYHDSIYFIFHLRFDSNFISPSYFSPRSFLYSKIDMSKESGMGEVVEKNVVIFKDTFAETLTAVRHANGRDWWIPVVKRFSNTIFLFRFGPDGVTGPKVSQVKYPWTCPNYSDGPITANVFSPKGDFYASMDYCNDIHVYSFDRCSGEFSGGEILPVENPTRSSLAISPNGRYLYASTSPDLYQYDLQAVPINSSRVLISHCTCIYAPVLPATYFQMQLAPNNKIYMSASNDVNVLHIIHQPDEKGLDCQFQEAGQPLPTLNDFGIPNYPYFRLHEEKGSPCDSITSVTTPILTIPVGSLIVSPNPAIGTINILVKNYRVDYIELFNSIGEQIFNQEIDLQPNQSMDIDLQQFPSGAYCVRVKYASGHPIVAKFIVLEK